MKQLKGKIAISINPELLARIDAMVDGVRMKSRSHAVETLLRRGLEESAPKKALMLAGGKGAAKVPLGERRKVIARLLEWLARHGVRDVVLVGGKSMQGSAGGLAASFIFEEKPLGTAGALALAKGLFDGTFLALYADISCDFSLASMLAQHARERPVATIALTEVENASRYGAVELEGLRIKGFVEKPSPGKEPSRLVNAGIYALEPRIFEFLPKQGSLERDVLPGLAKAGLVQGFVFTGEWRDASKETAR